VHVWESQYRHSLAVKALARAPGGDMAGIVAELDKALADAAAETTEQGVTLAREAGLDATGETVEDDVGVWRAIASLARARRAALIVTGARGIGGARSALLVDRSGQLVTTVGESLSFDPTTFATLTAADFSANDQLARLIGETDFTTLFHQGERESMYVADIARRLILVVLFDNRTPIGLVRLKMKPAVEELTGHLDRAFARARASGTTQPNILAGAGDEIDELFNW